MIKKTGYGSLSIIFFILAFLSSAKIARTFCLGDILFRAFGISPWSGGNQYGFHNTIYLTFAFLILGLVVGRLFKKDWGARNTWKLCAFIIILLGLSLLFLVPVVKSMG